MRTPTQGAIAFRVTATAFARVFLSVALVASLADCADDKLTGPGNKSHVATISAGEYDVTVAEWVCGSTDTMWTYRSTRECRDVDTDDDNSIFPCTVIEMEDTVSFECTEVSGVDGGCMITRTYEFSGLRDDDNWELTGKITETAEPDGCFPRAACTNVHLLVERKGPAPEYCAYGPINEIALTIAGGPDRVEASVPANALSATTEDGRYYSVYSGSIVKAARAAFAGPEGNVEFSFYFNTPAIDPESLPLKFDVAIDPVFEPVLPPEVFQPPEGEVTAGYTEWPRERSTQYYLATEAKGTLTIVAMTEEFIAGTFDIDFTGNETDQSGTHAGSRRTVKGSFNVESIILR